MGIERLGPYEIKRQLGRGGMGTVYEAVEIESGQPAAVKVLAPMLAAQEGFRERFESEIESLKQLSHPNIVTLYGYGQHDTSIYYAMELVEGASLEDELANGRRFDWRETCRIGIDLCRALKLAHDHGIIHRDLKPANLLWGADGTIKLTDFGIARLFGNTGLTSEGGVLGTAEYMAPEQADGRRVTHHCDLYSLGGVMYALLAGRAPFQGKSMLEMLQMQRYSKPDPVRRYAADAPKEFESIIAQLLEKEPKDRFPNALMVLRRLESMQRGLSVSGGPSGERAGSSVGADFEIVSDREAAAAQAENPLSVTIDADALLGHVGVTRDATLSPPDGPGATSGAEPLGEPVGEPTGEQDGEQAGEQAGGPVGQSSYTGASALGLDDDDEWEELPAGYDQFTTVEEVRRQEALLSRDENPLISGWTWGIIAALVGMALIVWYWLQPPPAEKLYQRIAAAAGEEDEKRLLEVEHDVKDFVAYYPEDPRVREVKRYQRRIDAVRLQRRAVFQARLLAKQHPDSPVATEYLAAIQRAESQPEEAAARLEALVDLYDNVPDAPQSVTDFVTAARQQLTGLREEIHRQAVVQIELLNFRLLDAQDVIDSDPQQARRIYQAIVTLYSEKPWAAEVVARARAALRQLDGDPGEDGS